MENKLQQLTQKLYDEGLEKGRMEADKLVENIKKEWAEFIVKSTEKGAQVGNPPANGGKALSREEILKIKDTSERQKAIAENLSAFGR